MGWVSCIGETGDVHDKSTKAGLSFSQQNRPFIDNTPSLSLQDNCFGLIPAHSAMFAVYACTIRRAAVSNTARYSLMHRQFFSADSFPFQHHMAKYQLL